MWAGRRIVLVGLGVGAIVAAGYAAAGLVALNVALAESGACHEQHAAFTPAQFSTNSNVSSEFDAETLDPTPYFMPEFDEVSFAARDEPAITIRAWWVPGPAADAPAVVVVHGEGSCRRDPAILVPAGMLHRQGFAVLLIDMRDNGDSTDEDGRYGAGSDEYRDVLGARDWLVARGIPPGRIGLFGHSGGAPAVVVAFGEDASIPAAWEESGPADFSQAAVEEARRKNLPEILVPAAIAWARILGDDLVARNPLTAAPKIGTRPLQVVHGMKDGRIGVHHAYDLERALQVANPDVRAWIIEGAHHVEGPFLLPDEYERRLGEFFGTALSG